MFLLPERVGRRLRPYLGQRWRLFEFFGIDHHAAWSTRVGHHHLEGPLGPEIRADGDAVGHPVSLGVLLTGGDGQGIVGHYFDAEGRRQGGEFIVNETISKDQTAPAIAMDASGKFVGRGTVHYVVLDIFLGIEQGHQAIVQAEIDALSGLGFWFDFQEFNLEAG